MVAFTGEPGDPYCEEDSAAMGTIEAPQRDAAADLLDRTADLVEEVPGMNVLDAMHAAATHQDAPPERVGDAYFLLLDYLPMHVDLLAPWADSETSDRVAAKLRQLVKTIRNGGPAHVAATPPTLPPAEAAVVDIASGRNRGTDHHVVHGDRTPKTPLALLQHERGVVLGAITRAKRAKHPDAAKLTENELRLVRIDEDIAALEDPDYAAELAERREADRQAVDLIAESQAFPADRRPASRSGL